VLLGLAGLVASQAENALYFAWVVLGVAAAVGVVGALVAGTGAWRLWVALRERRTLHLLRSIDTFEATQRADAASGQDKPG
jgi:hypothetical protein